MTILGMLPGGAEGNQTYAQYLGRPRVGYVVVLRGREGGVIFDRAKAASSSLFSRLFNTGRNCIRQRRMLRSA